MKYFNSTKLMTIALMMLLGTALHAQKVKTDLNPAYKTTELRTFAFVPVSSGDALNSRPDLAKKIHADLKMNLEKFGLHEDSQKPDFLVRYSAAREDQSSTYSSGPSGWNTSDSLTSTYTVGTLFTDFLDPKTNEPFWRGTATETVYAGTLQKYIPKGVRKLIEAFEKDRKK